MEFALILPVFLLILLGSIELGRAFVFGVAVQNGAREAARLAANARVDPAISDQLILQRFMDASSPAMLGCSPLGAVTSTPLTVKCGGGTWTFSMSVTPSGSSTSSSSFSSLSSAGASALNGGTAEVKVVGSVALLAGVGTGALGMSLPNVTVQGDALMVVL